MKSEIAKGDSQSTFFPLRELRVELLRGCPLLCVHCSAHAAPRHPLMLPLSRVLTLIDEFATGGGQRITFTGGEPLTYPGLEQTLQRAREQGLCIRLFSSGVVFEGNRRVAGSTLLRRFAPLLDTVMYSVYAAEANVHDSVTSVPGSFWLTIEAIKQTVALAIGTELHFVPTQTNYRDLPAVVALASELHVPRVGILRFVPQGRGKSKADELALDRTAHQWLRECIRELRSCYPQVALTTGSAYNLLAVDVPSPCNAGINQLVVNADGSILPCSAFGSVHVTDDMGNILRRPLQVVWQQSLYLQQVRHALNGITTCAGCLAQKTLAAGRIDAQVPDPLEGVVP
jgi:radical SAM protein with 4Fe4S-binding SPASM domain